MASFAFRIAASMDTNSSTGTVSGADILASETLPGSSLEQDDTQEERALKSVLEEWALGGSIDERALERILAETSEDEGGSE